jgi:hypothetical protein
MLATSLEEAVDMDDKGLLLAKIDSKRENPFVESGQNVRKLRRAPKCASRGGTTAALPPSPAPRMSSCTDP